MTCADLLTFAVVVVPEVFMGSHTRVSEPAVGSTDLTRLLAVAPAIQNTHLVRSVAPVLDAVEDVRHIQKLVTSAADRSAVILGEYAYKIISHQVEFRCFSSLLL